MNSFLLLVLFSFLLIISQITIINCFTTNEAFNCETHNPYNQRKVPFTVTEIEVKKEDYNELNLTFSMWLPTLHQQQQQHKQQHHQQKQQHKQQQQEQISVPVFVFISGLNGMYQLYKTF